MSTQGMKRVWVAAFMTLWVCGVAGAASEFYVDQTNGVNGTSTTGAADNPFKSITYAVGTMANRTLPDPWIVHIKAGTYDADPAKPANQREIFSIEMRSGMTLIGDDGPENCIISGAFTPSSSESLVGANSVSFTLDGLTFQNMNRTAGSKNGAACEMIYVSGGTIHNCIFKSNSAQQGGAGGISANLI